jgi:biotin carboxyl carrier protein
LKYIATVNGNDHAIELERPGEVEVDQVSHAVDLRLVDGESLYSLILDNESYEVFAERRDGQTFILLDGHRFVVDVEDARLKGLRAQGSAPHDEHGAAVVVAPMPGLVVKVMVEPGQEVARDQGLLILEAMKMENEIRCPRPGIVRTVGVSAGQAVNLGDTLVVVDADG